MEYITKGSVEDFDTGKVYELDGVKVLEGHIIGGNGLVAVNINNILHIERVEEHDENAFPTLTCTLVSEQIRNYIIRYE